MYWCFLLYKNEINNRITLEIIDIISTRPSWWIIYSLYIVNDKKITYKKDTTLIISLYSLKSHRIIILYNILKRFYKLELIEKVIYKKEFVIVHMKDEAAFKILTDPNYWKLMLVEYLIIKNHLEIEKENSISVINNTIEIKYLESNISKTLQFSYYIPTLEKRIKHLLIN